MLKCDICQSNKIKFFHELNNFSYYACQNCQTLFLHPKPTLKEVNDYYRKGFEYSAGEINQKQIRQRANKILEKLKNLNPKGRTLLDIGSGYGYFLDQAIKKGLEVNGVEPSKDLHSGTVKHIKEAEIFNMNFSDFFSKFKNKKFDFITIIHVIEHVLDPLAFISKTLKLLKSGGILYIETPNLDSHLFKTEKYSYTFLTPPDHIWLFSKESFFNILKKINHARIERISSYSNPEHLMGILKMLLKNPSGSINLNIGKSGPALLEKKEVDVSLKYFIFDKLLAPLFIPFLNIGIYGSILELYIRKK